MEALTIIESIILLVFGILQIILFFKIWRMCNDVREITSTLEQMHREAKQPVSKMKLDTTGEDAQSPFSVGQLVIVKGDESQFRIDEVIKEEDGVFKFFSKKFDRYYSENELDDFNDYWAKKK